MKDKMNNQLNGQQNNQPPTPWYKQKWPWLIMSLPFFTVVAGIITYQIAANNPASLVNDDYFKEGLAINQSLGKQRYAKELGLSVEFLIEKESQLISIKLTKNLKSNQINSETLNLDSEYLVLYFSHPTQQKKDKTIQLTRLTENEFVAELPDIPQADWHIRLTDNTQLWEIKSRWMVPQNQSLLINTLNQ